MPDQGNGIKKARPRPTAKALANLRPIKKGEIRNPQGGRAHNPMLRALKQYSSDIFSQVMQEVLTANSDQLKEMMRPGPDSNSLRRLVATAMDKAIQSGNYDFVERIADRLIGKIPDKIDLTANTKNTNTNTTHTEIAIKAALMKVDSDV